MTVFRMLAGIAGASTWAISVSFADRTCKRLVFDDEGVLVNEKPLPAHERIGFDNLLPLYGYRELNREQRRARQKFLAKHCGVANKVVKASLGCWDVSANEGVAGKKQARRTKERREFGKEIIAKLSAFVQQNRRPFRIEANELRFRKSPLPVFESFDGLEGLEIERDSVGQVTSLEIRSNKAARFVGGIWLEAATMSRVSCTVKRISGADIVAGAYLQVDQIDRSETRGDYANSEIDLAIVANDQLHVIEAKAVTNSKGIDSHVTKLVKIRHELGSQVMRCFLVTPLLEKDDLERGDYIVRAEQKGVNLLYGRSTLDDLDKEIALLVQGIHSSSPADGGPQGNMHSGR